MKLLRKIIKFKIMMRLLFYSSLNFQNIFIFVLFRNNKSKSRSKIKSIINLGDTHTNHKELTKVINFWEKINSIKDDIGEYENFKKNKKLKLNFIFNFDDIEKKDKLSLIKRLFSNLKKNYKNFPETTYIIFLNYFNLTKYIDPVLKKKIKTHDEQLSAFLLKNYCLRNFTHFNHIEDKSKFVKDYMDKYKSKYCLKILQNTVEYNIADAKLLRSIHLKIDKTSHKKNDLSKLPILGLLFYAFGHQLIFIDFFYRLKKMKIFDLKQDISMSIDYVANYCLTKYINLKYPKNSNIDNDKFFNNLSKNKFARIAANTYLFGKDASLYDLSYLEYKKNNFISPSFDLKILKKVFNEKKFKKFNVKGNYICLFHRDEQFKKENFKINSLNEDRTINLNDYKNVISYFCNNGYKVLLMGSSSQKKINLDNKNFIEYALSKNKNDFNDIYLVKNCTFILNFGQSGFVNFTQCFNKISLNLEFPFNRKPYFHNKNYYSLRPLYFRNKIMTKKDYFNNDLLQVHDYEILKKKGYLLKKTDEKSLIKKSKKFIRMLSNKNFEKFKYFPKPIGKINYFYNIID